ncbi:hypothetical protein EPO15_08280 [bacterium]|nr:MAG: hypothetical protein EPO15_08280 [bacterium]
MALDTHTKRLLWSGLRAGASSSAACAASVAAAIVLGERGPGWTGMLALAILVTGPVAFPWAFIRGQERLSPFTVRYPENSVPGALWGGLGAMMLFGAGAHSWAVAAVSAAAVGSIAAVVPYRIFWPALIISPFPPLLLHILLTP